MIFKMEEQLEFEIKYRSVNPILKGTILEGLEEYKNEELLKKIIERKQEVKNMRNDFIDLLNQLQYGTTRIE